jgi:hypothetical protein
MAYSKKINDAKKAAKKEQAAAEKLARSAVEESVKPSRKNLPKPKAPVSGELTAKEKKKSLWRAKKTG